MQLRLRTKSDEYRWMSIRANPVINHRGEVTGRVGGWTDIHDVVVAREEADARALYAVLVEVGGAEFAGPARELDKSVYWRPRALLERAEAAQHRAVVDPQQRGRAGDRRFWRIQDERVLIVLAEHRIVADERPVAACHSEILLPHAEAHVYAVGDAMP